MAKSNLNTAISVLTEISTLQKEAFKFYYKTRHERKSNFDFAVEKLKELKSVVYGIEVLKKSTNQGTKETLTAGQSE